MKIDKAVSHSAIMKALDVPHGLKWVEIEDALVDQFDGASHFWISPCEKDSYNFKLLPFEVRELLKTQFGRDEMILIYHDR
jgi:hypothetical protein